MSASTIRSMLRPLGVVAGALLLVAAVAVAARGVDWTTLRTASPKWLALSAVLIAANLLAAGVLNWIVTLSFDASPAVRLGRMCELMCASALLNYLPLRAGLLGRATYLKARHGLALRQSAIITGVIIGLGVAICAAAIVLTTVAPRWWAVWGLLFAVVASVVTRPIAERVLRRKVRAGWSWVWLRLLMLALAGARVWAAFVILGQPVSVELAVLAAAAGLLANLAGVTPNGLGLREWLIAAASATGAVGLQAALVDRAVEVIVVTILGLWSLRRLSGEVASTSGAPDSESPSPDA